MCQWHPDNKHPKRKCRHGHRHHEVLYNEIVPSETPVIWCNAPDCWTICSYGSSPKVYWGLRAWIADFFFTPIHRTDDVRRSDPDQPSIQRYQTFSDFNKLRYKDAPSTPSVPVPRARSEPSTMDYFTDNHAIIDIRPEKPKKSYQDVAGARATTAISAEPISGSTSNHQVTHGAQSNGSRSDYFTVRSHEPMLQAPNYETKTSPGGRFPTAETQSSYPYASPYLQSPLGTSGQGLHRYYPSISSTSLENQTRYPYPSPGTGERSLQTRKSDPTYSYATPLQELYSNYPGPLTPKYSDKVLYSPGPPSSNPYPRHVPSASPKPKGYTVPKIKKPKPRETREAKSKPVLSEYSPDVQALLGSQTSSPYSHYSPYGATRRI